MAFDELKIRLATKSTKELQKDFMLSKITFDKVYQELVLQELDNRDREYNDWVKNHNKEPA